MSKVRGLPDFETLWNRRTTVEIEHKVIDIAGLDPERCRLLSEDRPLLSHAAGGSLGGLFGGQLIKLGKQKLS